MITFDLSKLRIIHTLSSNNNIVDNMLIWNDNKSIKIASLILPHPKHITIFSPDKLSLPGPECTAATTQDFYINQTPPPAFCGNFYKFGYNSVVTSQIYQTVKSAENKSAITELQNSRGLEWKYWVPVGVTWESGVAGYVSLHRLSETTKSDQFKQWPFCRIVCGVQFLLVSVVGSFPK